MHICCQTDAFNWCIRWVLVFVFISVWGTQCSTFMSFCSWPWRLTNMLNGLSSSKHGGRGQKLKLTGSNELMQQNNIIWYIPIPIVFISLFFGKLIFPWQQNESYMIKRLVFSRRLDYWKTYQVTLATITLLMYSTIKLNVGYI